jgi:malonate-semialdehyde dehydrogenase (acetylating) / methylmalonate-semialdehyde dehydrogenase
MTQIPHFLNNRRHVSPTARPLAVTSPWDGAELGTVGLAGADAVENAVGAANEAFRRWSVTPVKERVQPLFRYRALCEKHLAELSEMISRENGKTVAEARAGIEKGLEVVEYACSAPQLLTGELLEVSAGVDCATRRYPLGICIGITPFNFPAMVPLWMYPLAIACGNTFILKPSEQVPMTPVRLAELFAEAGLPEGVFNVLHGDRATVELLLDHPDIAAVAFVGSTPVARSVYQRGTANNKRALALGGAKNHLVVVPDADPEVTAKNVVASATGCAGQRCMAASVLIAVGDCDPVLDAIAQTMKAIRPGVDMGAIISRSARERIIGYINRAEDEGAAIVVDGRNVCVPDREGGNYVGPTLIDNLRPDSAAVRDEIFGPVLSVLRVATLDEALAIENASPYGNAASIYTTSGNTARYFEQRASAGMIGVNIGVPVPREPFSFGGWNDSRFGMGDITGRDGLAFWTKVKKTTTKWTARAGQNWMS